MAAKKKTPKRKPQSSTAKKIGRPLRGDELVEVYAIRIPASVITRLNACAEAQMGATPRALARELVIQGVAALEKKLKGKKLRSLA
ncbi:MAG TPA: hypothetical protein VFH61_13915 [Thermoleophilia bacterium]|nr:hypothetical protein [Thermoleophilia bacterium]